MIQAHPLSMLVVNEDSFADVAIKVSSRTAAPPPGGGDTGQVLFGAWSATGTLVPLEFGAWTDTASVQHTVDEGNWATA